MNIKVESNVTIELGLVGSRITLNRNDAESLYSQLGVALGKTVSLNPGFIPNHPMPRKVAQDGTMAC